MSVLSRTTKWAKYKHMRSSSSLKLHLPETELLSPRSLWDMLDKYSQVVVKPTDGSKGIGVISISKIQTNHYEIHSENRRKKFNSKDRAYQYLISLCGSKTYIIQRGIKRADIGGNPFDIRVMVQRKRHSKQWEVTGIVAKVVGGGYFVSNRTWKGNLLPVGEVLSRSSLQGMSSHTLMSRLETVSKLSAEKLSTLYPSHRIYGIDVGLDREGKAWVFEVNLAPTMNYFYQLGDKSTIRKIMEYKK